MKTMTCNQLGGPDSCIHEFHAETWEQMAQASKAHAQQNMSDLDHQQAMQKMNQLMQDPQAMQKWMDDKQTEFNSLPKR